MNTGKAAWCGRLRLVSTSSRCITFLAIDDQPPVTPYLNQRAATITHHHEAWHDGPLEGESSAFHRTFHWTLELGALDPLATKPGRSLVYTTYGARARPDPSETLPRTQLPVNDIVNPLWAEVTTPRFAGRPAPGANTQNQAL
ncbi:hypothetical protein CPLU01_03440 [Colletotrichum plurivorum]|uniref:Uncharacterized protein n=1 Tax=Colletotrichum plurivorum TaxID=2175906 RepID=A0A8H6KSF4_9PEZI|nr:hypothetical protein CPLU01_03440 [Colletotrichum plurivorum]